MPYSPLNRGFLGGMINEYTRFDTANDNRQTLRVSSPKPSVPTRVSWRCIKRFRTDERHYHGAGGIGIGCNRRPFIVPIPGTTKLSHLEENLRACDIVFTSEEVTELEKAVAAIPVVGTAMTLCRNRKSRK